MIIMLNLTSQNLRDKVASLEKTMGNVMETVTSSVGQRDQELQELERNQDSEERENMIESEEIMNIRISTLCEVYQNIDSNLNINSSGGAPKEQEDKLSTMKSKSYCLKRQ